MSRPDMRLLRREHQTSPIARKIPPPPSRMSIVLGNLRRQQRTRRPPDSRVQQHAEPLLPCPTTGRTSEMHGKQMYIPDTQHRQPQDPSSLPPLTDRMSWLLEELDEKEELEDTRTNKLRRITFMIFKLR